MTLSLIMVAFGAVAIIVGFIGCIVPVLPGPIIAYLAIILISIAGGWGLFPLWVVIMLAVVAFAATILDNIFPALSSKKAGAGRPGVWGSVIGMIVGSFFTPIGTIIGAFLGALLGEVLFHTENKEPLKAALGVFKGTMLGILVKLVSTGIIAFYFIRGSIRLF